MSIANSGAGLVIDHTRTTPRPYKEALETLTYSVWDAAKALGIGRESCYSLIRSGQLKTLKVGEGGTRYRVPKSELEAFIQRQLNQGEMK